MGVSEICFEMKGARGPNITHVVKPVSKYKKQASSAFQLPLRSETIKPLIGVSFCAGIRLLTVDPGHPSRAARAPTCGAPFCAGIRLLTVDPGHPSRAARAPTCGAPFC